MPVDTKLKVLTDRKPDLDLVSSLWGGTQAMRDAGEIYLPRAESEEVRDWKIRRDRSFLTNFFNRSVKVMAGRLFEEYVTVANSSQQFVNFSQNVDLEGRNLHRFAYDITKTTIRDGLRFIVIDAPSAEGVKTAADERKSGIRPYFVEVDVRNVLGWKTDDIAGQRVLTQFRYMEVVTEPKDEFIDVAVEQIRVIEPNLVRLYRNDGKGNWVQVNEIQTSVNFCPVVPIYAGRQGFMDFEPPLLDLAWLNVAHWQSDSDQRHILHVARVPILFWAGAESKKDDNGNEVGVVVGANSLVTSGSADAKLSYTEHSGQAIGSGRQDLIDIEDKARSIGAEFTSPHKSGEQTATASAIDEAGDISDLSALAQNIKDSLELAFDMVGEMIGQPFQGEVTINTKLGIMTNPVNVAELVKLRAMGDISREGLFEVVNDEWGTNIDADTEKERLDMEGPAGESDAFA